MKKEYIKPEITVIEMQMEGSILAGSFGLSDEERDGSCFNARRHDYDWEDE